jgi:hypothetical protein
MAIQCVAADSHLRSSQTMGLQSSSSFSITCWINATWTGGARLSLVGIYGPATDVALGTPVTAVQIGTTAGGGELSFWTWGGGVLTGTAAGFMNAYNGLWVHIAYTYDGTNHRGYLNGTQVTTATTAQIAGYLNQVYINGFPTGVTNEVSNHQVDQYFLYRRTLAADEVKSIWAAGGSRHGIYKDIIARYEYDELASGANVTSVLDLSGNGHNLTTVGAGAALTYTYTNTYANANIRPVQ